MNRRGLDGKQRILSIIADDFERQEIKEKLKVSLKKFFIRYYFIIKFFIN